MHQSGRRYRPVPACGETHSPDESITLHSAYYFLQPQTIDADAAAYLKRMSDRGKGDFYSFGAGNTLDFTQFGSPVSKVRNVVRDIFVENASALWEKGKFLSDSDLDGLSDAFEKTLLSNPQLSDSDGNGISDGVEYGTTGKPCADAKCANAKANQYLACTWVDTKAPAGTRRFLDTDRDGLNDCEEQILLRSRRDRFDSNLDWIPDSIAFRNRIALASGSDESQLDPDFDNVSNYDEVKFGTPTDLRNDLVKGLERVKYGLKLSSATAKQNCYEVQAKGVRVLGDAATLRLYLLESNAVVSEKRFLRTATARVTRDKPEAVFKNADFK